MTRALVLSGGGAVGVAWESGLLAGLAEGGTDLSNADFILGTSAGSFVGAQLALGKTPAEIAATDLAGAIRAPAAAQAPDLTMLMTKMLELASGVRPAEQVRAEIGSWALSAQTISEADLIARFAPALGGSDGPWPSRPFACTAVDTADGSFMLWDAHARIGLARAVASSCAVPGISPPITFKGHRYMDGGMRSGSNADLAKGYDAVLVVLVAGRMLPESFRRRFEGELETLRDGGSRVDVIAPDDESAAAFGTNLMDPARRQPSAQAGLKQGRNEAARIGAFWS